MASSEKQERTQYKNVNGNESPVPDHHHHHHPPYRIPLSAKQVWTEEQRAEYLEQLLGWCSRAELFEARRMIAAVLPEETDPVRVLPRPVAIRIFRMLDPRSLSRCAGVCRSWRELAELDAFWKPKCVRRGWHLPYVQSKFESGAWKAHYVQQALLQKPRKTPALLARNVHVLQPVRLAGVADDDVDKISRLLGDQDDDGDNPDDHVAIMSRLVDAHWTQRGPPEPLPAPSPAIKAAQRTVSGKIKKATTRVIKDRWPELTVPAAERTLPGAARLMPDSDLAITAELDDVISDAVAEADRLAAAVAAAAGHSDAPAPTTDPATLRHMARRLMSLRDGLGDPGWAAAGWLPAAQQSATRTRGNSNATSGSPRQSGSRGTAGAGSAVAEALADPTKLEPQRRLVLSSKRGPSDSAPHIADDLHPRVVIVASSVPLHCMLVDAIRVDVAALPYEAGAVTLGLLLKRLARVLRGRIARSVAFVCPSTARTLELVRGFPLQMHSLDPKSPKSAAVVEFWRTLATHILPGPAGGRIDIFSDRLFRSVHATEFVTAAELIADRQVVPASLAFDELVHSTGPIVLKGRATPATAAQIRGMYFNHNKLLGWRGLEGHAADAVRTVQAVCSPMIERSISALTAAVTGRVVSEAFFGPWDAMVATLAGAIGQGLAQTQRRPAPDGPVQALGECLLDIAEQTRERTDQLASDPDMGLAEPLSTSPAGAPDHDDVFSLGDLAEVSLSARRLQLAQAVTKLLRSERDYVDALRFVQERYADPLKSAGAAAWPTATAPAVLRAKQPALSGDTAAVALRDTDSELPSRMTCRIMFGDLLRLLEVHQTFLIELQLRVSEWNERSGVVDILWNLRSAMDDAYFSYLDGVDGALAAVARSAERSKAFRSLMAECRSLPESNGRSLVDALLLPVGRSEAYTGFLAEMLAISPDDHKGRECLGQFQIFADKLAKLRHRPSRLRQGADALAGITGISDIKELWANQAPFLTDARFVEVSLKRLPESRDNDHVVMARLQDVRLLLFETSLVIARTHEEATDHGNSRRLVDTFVAEIPLEKLQARPLLELPTLQLFRVDGDGDGDGDATPGTVFFFEASSAEDRLRWLESMKSAIEQVRKPRDPERTKIRVVIPRRRVRAER